MASISDDLRKVLMAGVGAVAVATEKSKEWISEMSKKGEEAAEGSKDVIDDLAQKGEAAFEQGKVMSEEMKTKLSDAFERFRAEAQQMDVDDVIESFNGLTDDALTTLKEKLDILIAYRAEQKEKHEQDAQETDEPEQNDTTQNP